VRLVCPACLHPLPCLRPLPCATLNVPCPPPQVCAPGTASAVNIFVDSVIDKFDLYLSIAIESLGLRLLLPPGFSCAAAYNISSSCGNSKSGSAACPQASTIRVHAPASPVPVPATAHLRLTPAACALSVQVAFLESPLPGDSSWDFAGVSSKGAAAEQAQDLVVQMQADPNNPDSVSTEIVRMLRRSCVRAVACRMHARLTPALLPPLWLARRTAPGCS
jgi:hypothetical protein